MQSSIWRSKKKGQERPAPFEGKTKPYLHLTTKAYGKRLEDWFAALRKEEMKPADEDMRVLQKVAARILIEFGLDKDLISQSQR